MFRIFLILLFFVFFGGKTVAETIVPGGNDETFKIIIKDTVHSVSDTILVKGKTKGEAIFWWALGGIVGLHRIYLGTSPIVPVFYAVTLGGGMGLLFVSDLVAIIVTKDINRFANNDNIFMWVRDKSKKLP